MAKVPCKLVRVSDVPTLTDSGSLPHQPDDLMNGYITLFTRDSIEQAKKIYFPDGQVNAYQVSRQKLDAAGYVIMSIDDSSYMLIGPGDDPMKLMPVEALHQKIF